MDMIGGSFALRRCLLLDFRVQWRQLCHSQICGTAVAQQGTLAFCVSGELLFHLDICAREVLVAPHVKLQAEVSGGGEGTKFALKCFTSVLVLMYLESEGRLV